MTSKERGIETRVLLVALAPVIATAVALTLYFTLLRYNDVEAALRQRGIAMAHQLVAVVQYGLFSGNTAELNHLARVLSHEPGISAITIYDQHNVTLVSTGRPVASPLPADLKDGWSIESKDGTVLSFHSKVITTTVPLDDPYFETPSTRAPNLLLGSITIELSRTALVARKQEILIFTVGTALLILLIAGLIARRLGRDISEPVLALETVVTRIRAGLLASRVQPHPAGTLRTLEEGINEMAVALERAQKRSAEALNSSNKQLRQQSDFANALLEAQANAGVSLLIVDDGKIVFVNQAALEFSGRNREELEQLKVSDVLVPRDKDKFYRQYLRVLHGGALSSRLEVRVLAPNDEDRWAEIAIFGISRNERRLVAMLGVDITQRKRDAQKLLEAHKILQAQKEEAERSSAAKSRFLAAASHDLRQPMHALTLFTNQLQQHITAPEQSRLAGQIDAAVGNMSELLESLLDISKIDLASERPELRTIELGPLLQRIAIAYLHAAEDKQLRLRVVPTSLRISSDPRYLSRVVSNLVSNAVRYTGQGAILIGARRAGTNVRIEIWDTGIGIEQEHLPFVFHEFYQVANPERDANKGLGLGLAIVDRLARMLGHKILVRSRPRVGSVFSVLAARAPAEDARPDLIPMETEGAHILLTIDNYGLQVTLELMLKRWGYSVLPCQASEVTQILKTDSALFDLMVCDRSSLSRMDQELKPQEFADVPLIYITNNTAAPDPVLHKHQFSSLAEPIKPAALRALILHLLTRKDETDTKAESSAS